nr:hypothetical protein [Pseudomonas silesiensis]
MLEHLPGVDTDAPCAVAAAHGGLAATDLGAQRQLLSLVRLHPVIERLAVDHTPGLQDSLQVLLIQLAQIQCATKPGKGMRRNGHGLTIDRVERRYDVSVIIAPSGNDLTIRARAAVFFVRLEVGQGGLEQRYAAILVLQRRIVLLVEDKETIKVISILDAVFAREISVPDVQIQLEFFLDRVLEWLFGEGQYIFDAAELVFDVVQGFAILDVTVGKRGPVLGHGGQVPAGQLHFMLGKFQLALRRSPREPRRHAVFQEVVVDTPQVGIEHTCGGGNGCQ